MIVGLPPNNMPKLCNMGPKQRRALNSAEARWRKKVKSWPDMSSKRIASGSDSSSNEEESDVSSWETPEAAGGQRKMWLENEMKPNPEELNQTLISGTRAPPRKEDNATVVLKSKVGKAARRLSNESAGKVVNTMQGGLDEGAVDSATSSKDLYNNSCEKPAQRRSFDCTACGKQLFSVLEVLEHPDLGVGICKTCNDFIFSSPYTMDPQDSSEEQCRWCGEGGRIVMCDRCEKSFCEACIVRNFGPRDLALIVSNCNWSCFCCNPELLRVPLNELKEFQTSALQRSQITIFPLERKCATSARPLIARDANEDVMLEDKGDGATIAELLEREEERRRQNRGMWTNSVKVKSIAHKVCRKKLKVTSTLDPELRTKIRPPVTTEVKQKHELLTAKPAPASATPARAWIRPHQWEKQRQEAAERRKQAEAEGLKNVTNLPKDNPTHTNPNTLKNLSHCKEEEDAYQKQPSEIACLQMKSVDLSDAVVEHKDGVTKMVKFQIGE